MNVPINSESLIVVLSLVGSFLAGVLRKDSLPPWINDLFTTIFILLASFFSVLVAGNLGPNLITDITLVATQVTVLMAGPLKPLEQWVQVTINPGLPRNILKFPPTGGGSRSSTAFQPTLQSWTPRNTSTTDGG